MNNLINLNNNQLIFISLILIPLIILLICSFTKKNNYENIIIDIKEDFDVNEMLGINKTNLDDRKIDSNIPVINKNKKIEKENVNKPKKLKSYDDKTENIPTNELDIKNFNKKIPYINPTNNSKLANHNEKTDFDLKSKKCQFYDGKCPNGFTSLGSFSLLGESKLLCGGNDRKTVSAKAVATIKNGSVRKIELTEKGIGYKEPPKVIIIGSDNNDNATAKTVISDNGSVEGISIVYGGSGYTGTPIVKIDDPNISQCHLCCEF